MTVRRSRSSAPWAIRARGSILCSKSWRRLAHDPGWDARLVVLGAGAALDVWRRAAAPLNGAIEFLGFRRDVPQVLRGCDALVSPTRYEAYGLGVHEALCCGLPALVTRTAGVAERYPVELQDWLLPDPDDAADLADRLRRCASGPRRRVPRWRPSPSGSVPSPGMIWPSSS